jgi:deoxyribonuclease (pyrimidine dimer)
MKLLEYLHWPKTQSHLKFQITIGWVLDMLHFFYDKLAFVVKRYEDLCDEIRKRGFVCNQISSKELLVDMPTKFINDYSPTNIDIEISRNRILERLNEPI